MILILEPFAKHDLPSPATKRSMTVNSRLTNEGGEKLSIAQVAPLPTQAVSRMAAAALPWELGLAHKVFTPQIHCLVS